MAVFGQDRAKLRQFYHDVWSKMQTGQPLSALEKIIADVIASHPEYHQELSLPIDPDREFFVENGITNPYLHMGLHISIREQVSTDRPAGIRDLYQQLAHILGDPLAAEHQIMECLTESLWQAQRDQTQPSESGYLAAIHSLIDQQAKN